MTPSDDDTAAALQRLRDDGSDLERPMTLDFFVAVPDQSSGELVAAEVVGVGFEASVERDEESGEWTCYCTKTIVPTYEAVTRIEKQLDAVGRRYGGYVDGFGSYGNAN